MLKRIVQRRKRNARRSKIFNKLGKMFSADHKR